MNIQEATAEVERGLLSGVILDPSCIDVVNGIVNGLQFERTAYGCIFDHLVDLHAAGVPIADTSVLIAEVQKTEAFKELGVAGFARIRSEVATSAAVVYHAKEVLRFYRLRKLREIANSVCEDANDINADPAELSASLDLTAAIAKSHQRVASYAEMLHGLADRMDSDRSKEDISGIATGFSAVDYMTGGMMGGELIIIGARTSIGKTAFGMQLANQAAMDGRSTLMISLEMDELQLAQRVAASQIGLSLIDQRTAKHTSHDSERVRELARKFSKLNSHSLVARRATTAQIRGIARAQQATCGLDLLLVDYLQLVAPRNQKAKRYEQVTEISGELKTIAMELGVPVVALAQLNRQGENEAPQLSHLRESGSLEQDADSVWFLHRARDSQDTVLTIEKQRQGKRCTVDLHFDGERCMFTEPPISNNENYNDEFAEYA